VKFFFCTLVIFFGLAIYGQERDYKDSSYTYRINIHSDRNDELTTQVLKVATMCQDRLNGTIGKISNKAPTVYILIEGPPPPKDSFNVVYFKRDELNTANIYTILHPLIKKLAIRTLVDKGQTGEIFIPEWFIAGTIYSMELSNTLATMEKYPLTRHAIVSNKYPILKEILDGEAPSPKNYWIYRIFAEQSSVFMAGYRSINENQKSCLELLKDFKNDGSSELLKTADPTNLASETLRQRWYNNACVKACFDVINPYPPEVIKERIEELFSIATARPGSSNMTRTPLEKVFADEKKPLDFMVISFLEEEFFKIIIVSPESLRPSLGLFMACIKVLKLNKREQFIEGITIARARFSEALAKQTKAIAYLNELEAKDSNTYLNYSQIMLVEQHNEQKFARYFPRWVEYLNELETKLEAIDIK
jgi:hypothetical protein